MDDRLLAYARELEDADRALTRAAEEVDLLRRETAAVRARAHEVDTLLARLPAEREAAGEAVLAADRELGRRVQEQAEAERDLADAERSDDVGRIAAARRAVVRTRDAVTTAEARAGRARAARDRVEEEAGRAREEAPLLEERARSLAERLRTLPRVSTQAGEAPAPGLPGTVAWAARAEAALFVARGGLDSERERIAREANELGASALGEPLGATSVSLVRERLERN